jgi:hypothetical protein
MFSGNQGQEVNIALSAINSEFEYHFDEVIQTSCDHAIKPDGTLSLEAMRNSEVYELLSSLLSFSVSPDTQKFFLQQHVHHFFSQLQGKRPMSYRSVVSDSQPTRSIAIHTNERIREKAFDVLQFLLEKAFAFLAQFNLDYGSENPVFDFVDGRKDKFEDLDPKRYGIQEYLIY